MFQISRHDLDSYKIIATAEEWQALDAILNQSIAMYQETELETLLVLPEDESGKLENFKIQIATLTGGNKDYRLWEEDDFHLISLVVLELANKKIPDLNQEFHKSIYYQFGRLEKEVQKID